MRVLKILLHGIKDIITLIKEQIEIAQFFYAEKNCNAFGNDQ
jgi:hypothetical protein